MSTKSTVSKRHSVPKRRKKVERTLKGRVVYQRKTHWFSIKDVNRVVRRVILSTQGFSDSPGEFLADWSSVLSSTFELLDVYTNQTLINQSELNDQIYFLGQVYITLDGAEDQLKETLSKIGGILGGR